MESLKSIENNLKAYYAEKVDAPDPSKQMGWKSKWAQEIRFAQLLKVVEGEDAFSINDLGCGNGNLLHFLAAHWPNESFSYRGYDILPEMIAEAHKLNPNNKNDFALIASAKDVEVKDYTVASGIFNLKYNANDTEWLDFIHETIHAMWQKSNKGIAFNCLTSYSDVEYMKPELYYTNPLHLFDFCIKNFSRHVALLHDYREYDFTMIIRKA
jgi:SAM-dependent methyltransferase